MKTTVLLSRIGAISSLCLAVTFGSVAWAQPAPSSPPAQPAAGSAELNQTELLKAYLQLREQLHETQLAIANSRAEAEASARAQATATADRLAAIKLSLEDERERQRLELQYANTERERQRLEADRVNRTIMWITGVFGGVGLLAILSMSVFQWRTLHRVTTLATQQPALPGLGRDGALAIEGGLAADQTVATSNDRLLSVIARMERRILELEGPSKPADVTGSNSPIPPPEPAGSDNLPRIVALSEHASSIAQLLNKGRQFLSNNKPKEALACYDEILEIDVNNPEALVRKGVALEQLKRDEEALHCYNLAIRTNRKMTLAYLYKGAVCNRLARYVEAVESYEQALRAEDATV